MESGDMATWVGSIGGAIGAIATVVTLIWAVRVSLGEAKKSRELAADTERDKREHENEQKRLQAQQVYGWQGEPLRAGRQDWERVGSVGIYLGNSSNEPVYNVVAYLVWVQGAAYRTGEEAESYGVAMSDGFRMNDIRIVLQSLPPGRFVVNVEGTQDSPMQGQSGVELAFTDRAGRHWVRRALGQLEELDKNPIEHYAVYRPLQYSVAQPFM